jgi:hypothetical protein
VREVTPGQFAVIVLLAVLVWVILVVLISIAIGMIVG